MAQKKKKKKQSVLKGAGPEPDATQPNDGGGNSSGSDQGDRKPMPAKTKEQNAAEFKEEGNNKGSQNKVTKTKESNKGKEKEPGAIAKAITFLKSVQHEYSKITWPDRKQIIQETLSVLVLVTFITFLVLGYDYVLGKWVFGPLEHYSKMHAKPKDYEGIMPSGTSLPMLPPMEAPGEGVPPVGLPQETLESNPEGSKEGSPAGEALTPGAPPVTPAEQAAPGTTGGAQPKAPEAGSSTSAPQSTAPTPAGSSSSTAAPPAGASSEAGAPASAPPASKP